MNPPQVYMCSPSWTLLPPPFPYHPSGSVSLVVQMVENLPAMQKTRILSLGQEDPLEKGMATHSSILAWRTPWTEEPGGLQSMGLQTVSHDWVTDTTFCQEKPRQSMPFYLPTPCVELSLFYSTVDGPIDVERLGVIFYRRNWSGFLKAVWTIRGIATQGAFCVRSQHRSALWSTLTLKLLFAQSRMVSTALLSLAFPEIRMTACPEGQAAIIPTQTITPTLLCHSVSNGIKNKAAQSDNTYRQKKETRDLSARVWASMLGSPEPLVLALIILLCLPRENTSIPEETRKSKKEGMDARLQKRKEWKKLSFAMFKLSSVLLFMSSLVTAEKWDPLKKSHKQRRVQTQERTTAPRSIWGIFLEIQLAARNRKAWEKRTILEQ